MGPGARGWKKQDNRDSPDGGMRLGLLGDHRVRRLQPSPPSPLPTFQPGGGLPPLTLCIPNLIPSLTSSHPITDRAPLPHPAPHCSTPPSLPLTAPAPDGARLCAPRAAVGAAGLAVQLEPLAAGAAAALAASGRLGRPLGRHLLAAVPALRPRGPGGRVRTVRAARGLRAAPGGAAGARRHTAAPAAWRALHRARSRAQRSVWPGGRRGSHLRAGHRLHRRRG